MIYITIYKSGTVKVQDGSWKRYYRNASFKTSSDGRWSYVFQYRVTTKVKVREFTNTPISIIYK